MIHFTHTGPYAGLVFCDTPKGSDGDTFCHVGYGPEWSDAAINKRAEAGEICGKCAQIWIEQ